MFEIPVCPRVRYPGERVLCIDKLFTFVAVVVGGEKKIAIKCKARPDGRDRYLHRRYCRP